MTGGLALEDPAYFDRLARVEASHWWSASMWAIASAWLDRALRGRRDLEALDVGCGSGGMLDRLAKRPEIAGVWGVDPSPAALNRPTAKTGRVVRGCALGLPFPPGRFDLATCLDVFQHLPAGGDWAAARELFRVVRPGGIVLIRSNGRGLWPDGELDPPPYRLADLKAVVRDAGLDVLRASYVNCLPAVASEVVGRLRVRSSGHPGGRGLRIDVPSPARNRIMGWFAGAEAAIVGRGGWSLPVGHSTMILARRPGATGGATS